MTTGETREQKVARLTDEVGVLSQMSDPQSQEQAKEKKKQLAELEKGSDKPMADNELWGLEMTQEQWDKAPTGAGNRPDPGLHEAEMGIPVDHSKDSYKFPFTIVVDGPWKGHEDVLWGWKKAKTLEDGRVFAPTKAICVACGVGVVVKDNGVFFDPNDFPGKRFLAVYEPEPYRIEKEDGQVFEGTTSKAKRAKPLTAKVKETS